jgi:hypothetical protein
MCVSPFPQFSSKLSDIFFGERSDKSNSFSTSSKLLRAYFFDWDAMSEKWMTSFSAP